MSLSNSSSSISANELPSVDALRTIYADKQVGELFEFGRYPQGADGEIMPISWRVLQREKKHLLVIAEQCLDGKPYNAEHCTIEWAECTLRHWLNSEFYDQAFIEQERECVLKTSVVNESGPNTEDCIFLLNAYEARSLFADSDVRRAKPTEYAVANGIPIADNGYCFWWLRSLGSSICGSAGVDHEGVAYNFGFYISNDFTAVRPAFRIAL